HPQLGAAPGGRRRARRGSPGPRGRAGSRAGPAPARLRAPVPRLHHAALAAARDGDVLLQLRLPPARCDHLAADRSLRRGGGEARVLSPASVAAMTRDQIPGLASTYVTEVFPEASWGLGWSIHGRKKAQLEGSLLSAEAFSHTGTGGVYVWCDPPRDLLGVFF